MKPKESLLMTWKYTIYFFLKTLNLMHCLKAVAKVLDVTEELSLSWCTVCLE